MILNLTQHDASPEQVAAGVVAPSDENAPIIRKWLTFSELPDKFEIQWRADAIASLAMEEFDDEPTKRAMIGGAPYFMASLEAALREVGITPLYAFSLRESVDQVQEDGSTRKVAVFRHAGFITPP